MGRKKTLTDKQIVANLKAYRKEYYEKNKETRKALRVKQPSKGELRSEIESLKEENRILRFELDRFKGPNKPSRTLPVVDKNNLE